MGGRFAIGMIACVAFLATAILVPSAGAETGTIGQIAPAPNPNPNQCISCNFFQTATDAAVSPSYAVPPGNWTITSWSALAGTTGGQARMHLYRPGPGPGEYTLVGESAMETIPASTSGPFPTSVPAQGGDLLGLGTGPSPMNIGPGYATANAGDVAANVLGLPGPVLGDTVCGAGSTHPNCTSIPTNRVNVAATLFRPDPPPPMGACNRRAATIVGTADAEVIAGTPDKDVIVGLEGNDAIRGLGGRDVICGGAGGDRLIGGPGGDVLIGGQGKDRLIGGGGKDVLNPKRGGGGGGGGSKDSCKGGPGNDRGACED
jgi:Ca2+-binding RTX toxin-like protein